MLGDLLNSPINFIISLASLVIAITIHEFAHAWSADRLGDPTPSLQGRLTLNPLAHLDPLGTIMIIFARFGWGKPVQFDPYNLRHPRRDSAIISLAGPASNIILAIILAVIYNSYFAFRGNLPENLIMDTVLVLFMILFKSMIIINVVLAIFNLIPVHPLDGFKIVGGILPDEYAKQWNELEPYGMIFLIFLIFPVFGGVSPISQVINPVINFILSLLLPASGII